MRKLHVVRKQGYFRVEIAPNRSLPGRIRYFHSFEGASRYFRYHVSFLGFNYGIFSFVDNSDKPNIDLITVCRGYDA